MACVLNSGQIYPSVSVFLSRILISISQLASTCSELTIKTLEQGVKYVQS